MAEALGVAASILQIISTGVQVSLYLYNFAETVSSAGKALKEISDDITFTTSVLEQLRTTLESERHNGTASKEALSTADILVRECSNVFEAIMALVKKHFPEPREGRRSSVRLNNLKWPFIQPKIENLRSKLEKHKTKLILMTQVLTFAKIAASEQRNIDNQMEQARQKLEALLIVTHRAQIKSGYNVHPIGLTEVFNPSIQASVDVVFVHGIFGHPKDTWTCDDADVFWPAELLPPILEDERARILTYGYDAGADTFADGQAGHKIHEVVGNLGRDLISNRQIRKASERPLIFISHSLGGLIVKGVLTWSSNHQHDTSSNLHSISISTYGIIFLSTPHNLLPSHINLICDIAIQSSLSKVSETINRLRAKHSALQKLNTEFLDLADRYHLGCFREMLEPKILDDISARLSMLHERSTGIQCSHYRTSKFSSENSPGFDVVCATIQTYVYSAPEFIRSRWTEERVKNKLQSKISSSNVSSSTLRCSYDSYQHSYYGQEAMSSPINEPWNIPGNMPQGQQQNVAHIPSVKSSLSYRPVSNSRDSLIVRQMGSLRDQETSEINANVGDIHGTLVQDLPGLNIRRLASSSERNQSLNLPHHDVRTIDPAEQKLWETQPDEIARQPCEVYFKDNYPGFADARQGGGSSSNISAGYHTIDLSQMTRRQTQESISIKHSRNDTHALQDYQMQLMLLEQQNRKRAMIARQAQSNLSSDIEPPVPVDHINLSPISFRRSTSSHGPPTGLPYTSFSTVPKYQFHMSTASTQQMSQGEHAPLLENPSIDDVSLGLNDNTQQQETDISHEQLNSIYHYDRYAEVSGHMSVDDAEDADVLKSFDFESFLQDKEDDKGLDTKLETAPLSAPDHSLLLSLSPSTLNERKGSFASLAVERDSGSGRSDKQGERYHFTQPMREYGDEDPLRVAMNDFFGADHQSRSRGTPEKFGDEAFQHELASPDQGKGSTEVFGSPMESIAKGRPEGDDFEEVVGTITNWDQTADSQRPDLGLGRSLQNVVPRLESPKHGGYASRGKRKYRKRRKKTQGMDSVISSKQQVQNEEGSISRLSQELQCRGIQMENSCIVDDGRRVHRQTRSKTDTSPNVENNNNDSLVEVSEGTVLAAETPMIPAEGMKRPLGLPQPSGTVRTDAKYLRGNEEVMFGASQESRSSGIYETQANAGIGDGDIKNALVKEGSRLGQDVAIPRSREHFAPPPLAPPKQLCCIGKIQIPSRKPRTTGDCGIPEGASLNSSIWRRSRSTSPLTRTKPKTSRTPIKEMQGLVATDAERSRAQEEILKLLRQWTTCDSSIWTDERTQATQNA